MYSDEENSIRRNLVDPFFKPDWSPDSLRTVNEHLPPCQCAKNALRRRRWGLDRASMALKTTTSYFALTASARHVGHVVGTVPLSLASASRLDGILCARSSPRRTPPAGEPSRTSLGDTSLLPGGTRASLTTHRFRYPLRYEKVSIVIPFRDQPDLTDACVRSIAGSTPMLPMEVLLISNKSTEGRTHSFMDSWEDTFAWAHVLEYDEPFNFQRMNNWAAKHATGSLLLFLNNDIEALHSGWLEALAEHAQRPEIGAVGARLFYPDGLIQHAGVAVGIDGLADHPWAGQHPDAWTPAGPTSWTA